MKGLALACSDTGGASGTFIGRRPWELARATLPKENTTTIRAMGKPQPRFWQAICGYSA